MVFMRRRKKELKTGNQIVNKGMVVLKAISVKSGS